MWYVIPNQPALNTVLGLISYLLAIFTYAGSIRYVSECSSRVNTTSILIGSAEWVAMILLGIYSYFTLVSKNHFSNVVSGRILLERHPPGKELLGDESKSLYDTYSSVKGSDRA